MFMKLSDRPGFRDLSFIAPSRCRRYAALFSGISLRSMDFACSCARDACICCICYSILLKAALIYSGSIGAPVHPVGDAQHATLLDGVLVKNS